MTEPTLHTWNPGDLVHSADLNNNEAAINAEAAQAENDAQSAIEAAAASAARLTTDEAALTAAESSVGSFGTRLTADESSLATAITAEAGLTTSEAADASNIGSLTTRLTADEATLAADAAAVSAAGSLASRLTADESTLATDGTAIGTIEGKQSTDEANISSNTTSLTSVGTRLTTDESTLAADTSSLGTVTSKQTTDEANITSNTGSISALNTRLTTDEATISGLSAGTAARPMVAFDGVSMTILVSRQINKVVKLAQGRYQIFFASGVTPGSDIMIAGAHYPPFGIKCGGWWGSLPSGTDSTITLIGLERSLAQPWGVDSTTGLYTATVHVTFEAGSSSAANGYDASMICVEFVW